MMGRKTMRIVEGKSLCGTEERCAGGETGFVAVAI
jgi:hypothetical protein